ncbi:hypothetical protein cyc_08806 [Cyclospora cayetanensis]|uniref:Uncharacterized protein n=1 Tax=Cyclospora cayetanensis TaxID=88456 RepID=A0A1D3CVC5_9EIME|nr:hypothetical protein cyc_08806 [Cyclospora cayetanensis]
MAVSSRGKRRAAPVAAGGGGGTGGGEGGRSNPFDVMGNKKTKRKILGLKVKGTERNLSKNLKPPFLWLFFPQNPHPSG